MERDPNPSELNGQPGVSLNKNASFEAPAADNSTPPIPAPVVAPGAVSDDERNLGVLAHAAGIVTCFTGFGFLPPLILWQINKNSRPMAANEAIEALNFQLTATLAIIVCWILMLVVIGALLLPLVWLGVFVLSIIATIRVFKGESYRYPLTIDFIRKS